MHINDYGSIYLMLTIDIVGVTYLFGLWLMVDLVHRSKLSAVIMLIRLWRMVDGVHRSKLSTVITLMLTLTLDYHNHAGDFCYYLWT